MQAKLNFTIVRIVIFGNLLFALVHTQIFYSQIYFYIRIVHNLILTFDVLIAMKSIGVNLQPLSVQLSVQI